MADDLNFFQRGVAWLASVSAVPVGMPNDGVDTPWYDSRYRAGTLADKTWEETKDILEKRYKRAIRRLTQTASEDVFQTLMNAFARSIEAHTSYLSPRNTERFQMSMNLELEGIGAVLRSEEDYTVIMSLVAGGPADKNGQIKPQDKIIGVAQENESAFVDVVGWRLDEVVDLIKGN